MGILTEYCAFPLLYNRYWSPESPLSTLLYLLAFAALVLGLWQPFLEKMFENEGLRKILKIVLLAAAFLLLCAGIAEDYRAQNS